MLVLAHTLQRHSCAMDSVADPGCLSGIPDPDFYLSRIQKQQQKRGETNLLSNLFLWPQISKIKNEK